MDEATLLTIIETNLKREGGFQDWLHSKCKNKLLKLGLQLLQQYQKTELSFDIKLEGRPLKPVLYCDDEWMAGDLADIHSGWWIDLGHKIPFSRLHKQIADCASVTVHPPFMRSIFKIAAEKYEPEILKRWQAALNSPRARKSAAKFEAAQRRRDFKKLVGWLMVRKFDKDTVIEAWNQAQVQAVQNS